MTDLNAKAVEAATRARIQAQNPDYPLTDAAWGSLRSRVEVEWMRAALAAALPYLAQPARVVPSVEDAKAEAARLYADGGDPGTEPFEVAADREAFVRGFMHAMAQTTAAPTVAEVREQVARELLAVDPVEWALAGQHAGQNAARIARGETKGGDRA